MGSSIRHMRIRIAVLCVLCAALLLAQNVPTDWINSPEAYFSTASERAEWFRLTTDEQRTAFKQRYWAMRGERFKAVILDRIRKADAKFSIKDGPIGSLTAQGMVYIVFGPPAFVTTTGGGGVIRPTVSAD